MKIRAGGGYLCYMSSIRDPAEILALQFIFLSFKNEYFRDFKTRLTLNLYFLLQERIRRFCLHLLF